MAPSGQDLRPRVQHGAKRTTGPGPVAGCMDQGMAAVGPVSGRFELFDLVDADHDQPLPRFPAKGKTCHSESIEQLEEDFGGIERQLPVENPNPTERLERADLRARIDQALDQLSDSHRTVLVLYEFEHLDYRTISERMSCSIGTVMSRLFYARRKMAALLSDLKSENENE